MTERVRKINSADKIAYISASFKLLSDPTRLRILCILFENKEGLCVYEIADSVGISQSAASHQLAKLEAKGIVSSFREGQMICYAIVENTETSNLEKMINMLRK